MAIVPGHNDHAGDCFVILAMDFVEEPPKYVFKDEWFDIKISAIFSSTRVEEKINGKDKHTDETTTTSVLLKPTLCRYQKNSLIQTDGHAPSSQNKVSSGIVLPKGLQLEMNPEVITLRWDEEEQQTATNKGITKEERAQCKISDMAESMDVASFSEDYRLEFHAFNELNKCLKGKTVVSRSFCIVDAKLSLDSPEWDEVWYKDMGGKEKSMRASLSLVDAHGNLVKNRKIPLEFTLLYDNEYKSPVSNQKIFRILEDSSQHIDPKTGETLVKFRIDDVSKNHQGQNFILEVAAHDCPGIAPAYSKSVCIRSKKRRICNSHNRKRQKMNPDNTTGQIMDQQHSLGVDYRSDNQFGVGSNYDVQQLKGAMQDIIQWIEEVVNGLEPLKWTIIGYAQSQEGDIDYNRPFHNMINPNDKLDEILQRYSEGVQDHLRVVSSAIEVLWSSYPAGTSCLHQSINSNHDSGSCYPGHFYTTPYHDSPDQTCHKSTGGAQPIWHESSKQYTSSNIEYLPQRGSVVSPQGLQGRHSRDEGSSRSLPYEESCDPTHRAGRNTLTPGDLCSTNGVGTGILSYSNHDEHDESDFTSTPAECRLPSDIFYIFAKVFKSLKTDQVLGFPTYNEYKELIGFYKVSNLTLGRSGESFEPIVRYREEFGPDELIQAKRVLQDAMSRQSKAVLSLEDWGSVSNMIEHVSYSYNIK